MWHTYIFKNYKNKNLSKSDINQANLINNNQEAIKTLNINNFGNGRYFNSQFYYIVANKEKI